MLHLTQLAVHLSKISPTVSSRFTDTSPDARMSLNHDRTTVGEVKQLVTEFLVLAKEEKNM